MLFFKIGKDWQEVELNKENEVIALNYNFASLENPTLYQSEFSYNINIERTPKNDKLLENYFRLDSLIGDYFTANSKIDFIYILDNQIISNGCTALQSISETHYTFALNGSLTNIFLKAINSGWADNPNPNDFDYFQITDVLENCRLTPSLVKKSWENDNYNFSFISFENITDIEDKFTQIAGFIPTNFNEYTEFDTDKWKIGNNIAGLFKLSDNTESNVDYSDEEINETVMCEYRCYEQQPYIYVSRLYQLYQKYFKQITGYDLVLDSRWFSNNYGFLQNLIYVLPKLNTEAVIETNQYTENFGKFFTYPFNDALTYNHTIISSNTITCSGANQAIFEWTLPLEFDIPTLSKNKTKAFNIKYAIKLNVKVKNSEETFEDKTYIYLPVPNDTDDEGNLKFTTLDIYKQSWRNAGYEVVEYVYDTEQRQENNDITVRFGFLNGKMLLKDLTDAHLEINFSFVPNPQYQIISTNNLVLGQYDDNFNAILRSEAIIDTSLKFSNSYNSEINMKRLFGDIKPFTILLKHSKLNGLVWVLDVYKQEIRLLRRADYFYDCFYDTTLLKGKLSSTHPYKDLYDITNITDLQDYRILPMDWTTRDITLNFDVGDDTYGKTYQEKYGKTFGSKLIHTQNKLNQDNKDLFCTSDYDRINPPIFSAEFIRPLQWISNNINKKVQDDNKLVATSNCFCYRLSNTLYDVEVRNGYRIDDNGNAYVLISGDTELENFNNLYCWHYQKETVDEITTVRPTFSECNKNNFSLLFAEPYEYYSREYPSAKATKYIYDEQMREYFEELYNINNKSLECKIYITSELFLRLKNNPFVVLGNVAYIVSEIFDWRGEGFTKCKLRQVTNIETLFKKSTVKPKKNINVDLNINPIEPDEPEIDETENEALILTNLADTQNTFTVNLPTDTNYSYKLNSTDDWQTTSGNNSFTVESNSNLYLKDTYKTSSSITPIITATANFKVSGVLPNGNIDNAYSYMFSRNSFLTDASELKLTATELASYSYANMFQNCTSLVNAPIIEATTLADYSCRSMFYSCYSLVNAPIIKATTLAVSCYTYMFAGCSSLNYIKCYIEKWNTENTFNWLQGVENEGILETNCSNISTNTWSGVPSGWLLKPIQD